MTIPADVLKRLLPPAPRAGSATQYTTAEMLAMELTRARAALENMIPLYISMGDALQPWSPAYGQALLAAQDCLPKEVETTH